MEYLEAGKQFISGVGNLELFLGYFVIFLGALDIVATFLLPASAVAKIPQIIRVVNVTLKAVRYVQEGFKKMEESKGGFTLEKEEIVKTEAKEAKEETLNR